MTAVNIFTKESLTKYTEKNYINKIDGNETYWKKRKTDIRKQQLAH